MRRRSQSSGRTGPNVDDRSTGGLGGIDRVAYDPRSQTYIASFDASAPDSPVVPLLELVATIEDTDPNELESAFEDVDPDALNRLFDPACDDTTPASGLVSLRLLGHHVTVFASGTIVVRP